MEDYKKKYEEALENLKKIKAANKDNKALVDFIEYKYPKLKESDDERMRKFISHELACLRASEEKGSDRYEELTNAIAWLEKQGEQKPLNKVEQEDVELTDFESALFSAFSDAWQKYLSGEEVNVVKWAREHSAELLEVAREQNPAWSEKDEIGLGDALCAIEQVRTIPCDNTK